MGSSGARSGGPDTTEAGTDDGYQYVPNRRSRVSDRAPNAAPERRRSPSWPQRRTARREFEDEEAAMVSAHSAFAAENFTFRIGCEQGTP